MVSSTGNNSLSDCDNTVCEDCAFEESIGDDTTEHATILGGIYVNPYSIQAITQAYNNIHGTNISSVSTTHYYVKFKPQTLNDLELLDSLDLEVYDYPLDKEVLQEGDYWPDAYLNLSANEFPWLYTVVESGFQFPTGITYTILAPLNIPDDDEILEDEAFRITGNYNEFDCESTALEGGEFETQDNFPCEAQVCQEGYEYDYNSCSCVPTPIACSPGFYWNGSACVPLQTTSTNTFPKGMITFKTYEDDGVAPQSAPVKYTRIVGRRFFKIDKTYTDPNGNFSFTKRFPRKVTIVVKFKLSSMMGKHVVRQESNGFGLWKQIFPFKKNIGTYKGKDLRNLNYEFKKGTKSRNWTTRRWLACISLNTALETNGFLAIHGLQVIDEKIRIFLMHPNRQGTEAPQYKFIYNSTVGEKRIYLSWTTTDINSLTTSKVTINVAQQLGLIYLSKLDGVSQNSLDYGSSLSSGGGTSNPPFGDGIPTLLYKPQIVAIWQSFAQHLGHSVANQFFGIGQSHFELQGKTWTSSANLNSSIKYLEEFDPSIQPPDEPFRWIPVGIINDLMDNVSDPFPVNDNVSDFTYLEIQAALQTKPSLMVDFKNALKSIKPIQSVAIDQLFASYGY